MRFGTRPVTGMTLEEAWEVCRVLDEFDETRRDYRTAVAVLITRPTVEDLQRPMRTRAADRA